MNREEAVALYEAKHWEEMTIKERGLFQLYEKRLTMPFDLFHEGVEELLHRPVYTHEFAATDLLKKEYETGKYQNSFNEVLTRAGF